MKPYNSDSSKGQQVRQMFNAIAPTYDTLNHLLSFGIDHYWRRTVVKHCKSVAPLRILDVATGTGDMIIALAKEFETARLFGADISEGMVNIARQKVINKGLNRRITFNIAEAEELPFNDFEFDAVTVAFGVRNFSDLKKGVNELFRVVRRGGKVCILEFSTPDNKLFGAIYRLYFHKILPWIGGLISRDRAAYNYLPKSVDEFPPCEAFEEMLIGAGSKECQIISLMGGIARLYVCTKI